MEATTTSSFLALLVFIFLETTSMTLLLHTIRTTHTTRAITTPLVELIGLISHGIRLATIPSELGIVLVLIVMVVVMIVSPAVSAGILVISPRCTSLVRVLLRMLIIMRSAVALILSHDLLVAKATLGDATKLTVSIVVADTALRLPHIELMLTIMSQSRVAVRDGSRHSRRNAGA